MKNLLITILNIFITIFVILLMVKGFSIGNFKILSISEIFDKKQVIEKVIEDLIYL